MVVPEHDRAFSLIAESPYFGRPFTGNVLSPGSFENSRRERGRLPPMRPTGGNLVNLDVASLTPANRTEHGPTLGDLQVGSMLCCRGPLPPVYCIQCKCWLYVSAGELVLQRVTNAGQPACDFAHVQQ